MDFTATSHAGMRKSKLYVVENERWSRLTGLQTAREHAAPRRERQTPKLSR